jgi:hypothetical protein
VLGVNSIKIHFLNKSQSIQTLLLALYEIGSEGNVLENPWFSRFSRQYKEKFMLSSWIAANKHGHPFFAFFRRGGGFSW